MRRGGPPACADLELVEVVDHRGAAHIDASARSPTTTTRRTMTLSEPLTARVQAPDQRRDAHDDAGPAERPAGHPLRDDPPTARHRDRQPDQ